MNRSLRIISLINWIVGKIKEHEEDIGDIPIFDYDSYWLGYVQALKDVKERL